MNFTKKNIQVTQRMLFFYRTTLRSVAIITPGNELPNLVASSSKSLPQSQCLLVSQVQNYRALMKVQNCTWVQNYTYFLEDSMSPKAQLRFSYYLTLNDGLVYSYSFLYFVIVTALPVRDWVKLGEVLCSASIYLHRLFRLCSI